MTTQLKLKKSWSWKAFIFTPFWLGYNGMYKLYTLNLLTYVLELLICYILNLNEINFQMTGVLPSISSFFFGLYGKSLQANLQSRLNLQEKALQKSWLSLIGAVLLSILALGITVALISSLELHKTLGVQSEDISIVSFSVFVLSSITYIFIFLFQGILAIIFLLMTLFSIAMILYFTYIEQTTENYLHYFSSAGREDFINNIPDIAKEKIDGLTKEKDDYLRLDNVKQNGVLVISFCQKDNDEKYYFIEYKISNQDVFQTKRCYSKQVTLTLFNKFYNNDMTYKTDVKWNILKSNE